MELIKIIKKYWPNIKWKISKLNSKKFHEASLLKLNCNKAKSFLNWKTVLNFDETVKLTTKWYWNFYNSKKRIDDISLVQIKKYKEIFKKRIY